MHQPGLPNFATSTNQQHRRVRMERMMLDKQYLEAARDLLRAARTMTDPRIASELRTLAEDYERRAERAWQAGAAHPLSGSAARVRSGPRVVEQGSFRPEGRQAPCRLCSNAG